MGAKWNAKDAFFEVGFMATGGYEDGLGTVPAHTHLPTKAAVDMVGDALKYAPIADPDGSTGIVAHIDVGNNYQGDPYVIPWTATAANLARGGEMIAEQFCVPDEEAEITCDFPDFAGVVGWKSGYQFLRDAVTNPTAPVAQHQNRFESEPPAQLPLRAVRARARLGVERRGCPDEDLRHRRPAGRRPDGDARVLG